MKAAAAIALVVLGALLVADICLRIRFQSSHTASIADSVFGKPLYVTVGHTNSAIGAADTVVMQRSGVWEPLWMEFCMEHHGKPDILTYFFQGKDTFEVFLNSNRPPQFTVYFRGVGKSVTWWLDRGGTGAFTERIFYDTNGVFSNMRFGIASDGRQWIAGTKPTVLLLTANGGNFGWKRTAHGA